MKREAEAKAELGRPAAGRLLTQGITAWRAGKRARARDLLGQLLCDEPENEQAWLWLALASENPRQARACLRRALRINPANVQAARRLCQVSRQLQPAGVLLERRPVARRAVYSYAHLFRRWLGIWLLVAALAIVLGGFVAQAWVQGGRGAGPVRLSTPAGAPALTVTPTWTPTRTVSQRVAAQLPGLEDFWRARDWDAALDALNEMALLDAAYPGLDAARCDTLLHWAGDEVDRGEIAHAYKLYRRAAGICREPDAALAEQALALSYLSGRWRYDRARWPAAAKAFQEVYRVNPDYADVRRLLYRACVSWAESALAQGDLASARRAGQAALAIKPDDEQVAALLAQVERMLAPTPVSRAASNKRIEVNVSQQRVYVWQGDTLLYNWVCSTGEPGRATATGHFRVLDKIPEAWASTWRLRMPYWLGIYQAGSLQNGIHALPILPNGQMLWAGYLGSRVSYGCVILGTENARILYNWAEIGTPVWIHY